LKERKNNNSYKLVCCCSFNVNLALNP